MIQTNEGVKKMKKEVINSPIRWAGSKKKILNEVLTLFDKESEYYVEPFLGSGVVLINLMNNIKEFKFKKFYVNDINENIINFYIILRDNVEFLNENIYTITDKYNKIKDINEKEVFYYNIREKYNKIDNNNDKKTIYFYFLMKAGYNGVYRENKNGKFNVPFGKKEKINCDIENMRQISKKLQCVEFYNYDYDIFLKMLKKQNVLQKAFAYFDPPYIPEEKVINKKQELYTNTIFKHEKFVENISKIEINKFLISMSESNKADQIYGNFNKYKVNEITRTINPKKAIKSTEIVYSNFNIIKKYNDK
jgi:DNA adenine methylase